MALCLSREAQSHNLGADSLCSQPSTTICDESNIFLKNGHALKSLMRKGISREYHGGDIIMTVDGAWTMMDEEHQQRSSEGRGA